MTLSNMLSKETLQSLLDKSNREIAKMYNCSDSTIRKIIKEYSLQRTLEQKQKIEQERINKSRNNQEKRLNTLKERYGENFIYENTIRMREKCSPKEIWEGLKKKYGEKGYFASDAYKNKMKEKYGEDNIAKSSYYQKVFTDNKEAIEKRNNKMQQTMLSRYGVKNPLQSKEIQNKVKQTNLERYGCEYVSQNEDVKNKIKQTNIKKYGMPSPSHKKGCRNSKINIKWREFLKENNIDFEEEFYLENHYYDFKIGNYLLEINPSFSHQTDAKSNYFRSLDKNYHLEKTRIAEANNYECIHIWDWDDKQKIIQLLKKKEEIKLKKCIIKEVNKKEADEFLEQYHLQGKCNGNIINIALLYEDRIVSLVTFGKSRYNKNFEYEWLRYCSSHIIHRGVSKLFNYFVDKYKPKSIVSYCDKSKFNGKMFTHLNFIEKKNNPSLHYKEIRSPYRHFTFNEVNKIGACKLLNIPQIEKHYENGILIDNDYIMINHNFIKIYDCGQSRYEWHNIN